MRLLVSVEGQTEENFVNQVLAPHLYGWGYQEVSARILGNPRKTTRGGICGWPEARNDFERRILEDPRLLQTTMVDFYGMPDRGQKAWPGRAAATGVSGAEKATYVERAILEELERSLRGKVWPLPFIPFVVVHEFEGLLFSDCQGLAKAMDRPDLAEELQQIRDGFATPEEINDSPDTSPSHRLLALQPNYTKPLFGIRAAKQIGLAAIRSACPHFHVWLTGLERWVTERQR
jgi:hypothetical protein